MFVLDTESPVAQAILKPPIVVKFPIEWRLGLQVCSISPGLCGAEPECRASCVLGRHSTDWDILRSEKNLFHLMVGEGVVCQVEQLMEVE